MPRLRRLLATGIAGALLGVALAAAAPPAPTAASASLDDCYCWDPGGYGRYMCAGDDECWAGVDICHVNCF